MRRTNKNGATEEIPAIFIVSSITWQRADGCGEISELYKLISTHCMRSRIKIMQLGFMSAISPTSRWKRYSPLARPQATPAWR